jgi:holo-[acyl-carrier protein] synthase
MVVGCGIDLVEIARVRDERERDRAGFEESLFTANEIAACASRRDPARHYAACFAAKEAFLKAAGSGAPDAGAWRAIELVRGARGEPGLRVHGAAADRARVALSVGAEWAVAAVVLER